MAATDYVFKSKDNKVFLTRLLKNDVWSKDSREITPNEIVGVFSFYFQRYCLENKTDGMEITIDGKKLFKVMLCDEEKENTPKVEAQPEEDVTQKTVKKTTKPRKKNGK